MTVVDTYPHAVKHIENTWITLSDGCRLAARIWMPQDAEASPVPAILEYLPYRKRDGTAVRDALTHPYFAGHGYAAIRVDMRGSGDSEGLMRDEYLAQEQDDALEVIEWLRARSWSDGNVGMIGISWGGFNGLQVAYRRPEGLKAVVTICSTVDRYADDIHYKGGCLLNENLGWSATMFSYSSRPPDPALVGDSWREMWLERLRNNPLLAIDWLRHQRRDAYWAHGSICEDYGRIEAAVLAVGGWNDAYTNAVPSMLANLEAPTRGLIGPWLHKYPHFAVPGPAIGFLQECLRWWDRWLKNIDTGVNDDPDLRAYIQDALPPRASYPTRPGRWVQEENWPSPDIQDHRYFLNQDRGLSATAGAVTSAVISSPLATGIAGGEYCMIWLGPEGPTDQRYDDAGSLCFETPALDGVVEILGAPVVALTISSDTPKAQLAVRLCDVAPNGESSRVTYGVLNLTHRGSHAEPKPLIPDERVKVTIKLDDIGYAFPAGHKIRLAISTSYWPLLWPSPERATVDVVTGDSHLTLPQRPHQDNTPTPQFEPAETSPPLAQEALRPSGNTRTISTDVETGRVEVRIEDDFGKSKNLEHGLITGGVGRELHVIHPDDPLSARAETHWTQELERDDWRVRTETFSAMWSDATHFHVTGRLEAYEGDELIFERNYADSIERDGL
jgi:uncharacterized protein